MLGARLNNTRPPGPCPELFCDRRHLHILHTYGVRRGSGRISAFPIYGRPTASCAGHAALRIRKPRRQETEREARGLPRTRDAHTRMRCGARSRRPPHGVSAGDLVLNQKALGQAAATGARGTARHGGTHSRQRQIVERHGADASKRTGKFAAGPMSTGEPGMLSAELQAEKTRLRACDVMRGSPGKRQAWVRIGTGFASGAPAHSPH